MSQARANGTGHGVVAIIQRAERYLMIQRAPGILAGGSWCFVGGAIEPGENQEQAVVREVREEVGLSVEPLRRVWECLSPNRQWRLHCWETRMLSSAVSPNPAEVADYRWLTRQEIDAWPNLLPSVQEFFKTMNGLDR